MISNKIRTFACLMPNGVRGICTASVLEAARKGTRMKAEAKKRANKKVVIKKEFVPYKIKQEMERVGTISVRIDDSNRGFPVDDVYYRGMYRWPTYSLQEAITMHNETSHPTQFNRPNADVLAVIECSMAANKKNHFLEAFSNILLLPHQHEVQHSRSILTISKDEETVDKMRKLGVNLSLGREAVKMIEKGDIDVKMYDFIVCQSELLPDLLPVRNTLKKKFPAVRTGTAGTNIEALALKFLKGMKYELVKDKYDHDYAKVVAKIGTLQTEVSHLEENLEALLKDIENTKPKSRTADIITLVQIGCETTSETFKINHQKYFAPTEVPEDEILDTETRELRA